MQMILDIFHHAVMLHYVKNKASQQISIETEQHPISFHCLLLSRHFSVMMASSMNPPSRATFINFFILKRGVYTSLCRSHAGMLRPVEQHVQADAGYTGVHGRSQQVFWSTESWKFPCQHPPRWATGCPEARGTEASCYTGEEKVNFLHHLLLGNADIHELLWLSDLVAREAFVTLISNWWKMGLESRGFCLIVTFLNAWNWNSDTLNCFF